MSYQHSRTRSPGCYSALSQDKNPTSSRFSPSSTSSSWRDRDERGGGFYEIDVRRSHIAKYQTYAKQSKSSLISSLFSESSPIKHSSGAIQLVLGIKKEGTQHLLIQVDHYDKLRTSYSQRLPQLNFHPPQDFDVLSPIAFRAPVGDGECELSNKLNSITKMGKKRFTCITTTEVKERINYEHSRVLLRVLRGDTLFFDVPNPQIGCFVILYTNNAMVGPVAKDIVFGIVHADRLRDRDALTEQITPNDIEHIRIADGDMFYAKNELKDLPTGKSVMSKSDSLPYIEHYLSRLRRKILGEVIVLVDDWSKVLEALLPGGPPPIALTGQSTFGRLRWLRGIAPLLEYNSSTQSLNRPMKGKDEDRHQDYGSSRNRYSSVHTSTRRRSPSPVCAPDFYVVETRRMYKVVRGSGNLPESARDGCTAFGLDIPDSGTGLDELKLIWSLWVKMAGGLSMDEERTRNWRKNVTLGTPDDEEEEAQQQEAVPTEPESLEAILNDSAVAPTHQPVFRRKIKGAFDDLESDEDDF